MLGHILTKIQNIQAKTFQNQWSKSQEPQISQD